MPVPLRRSPFLAAAVVALLGLTAPRALAQGEVPTGSFRIEGRTSDGETYSATLWIGRTSAGAYEVERTERPAVVRDVEDVVVWSAASTTPHGSVLDARFGVVEGGMAEAVAAALPSVAADAAPVRATYYFAADGGVTEFLHRDPPDDDDDDDEPGWSWGYGQGRRDHPELVLEREARLADLLGDALDRYEASGVVHVAGRLHVVFDNDHDVAVVPADLDPLDAALVDTDAGSGESDFEGLTWDPGRERFHVVVEADRRDGDWTGRVFDLDADLAFEDDDWLTGYELESDGKGVEGLAYVRALEGPGDPEDFLLALLEGNEGRVGSDGQRRGRGRIALFERKSGRWEHEETIALPRAAFFRDYSGIDVRGDRVAVVSQTSSLLWIGRLGTEPWEITGDGAVYRFPRRRSRLRYATVEGVTWLDDDRLAVVSDRAETPLGAEVDQSVHVFRLP